MHDIILILLCLLVCVLCIYVAVQFQRDFLKEFEFTCKKTIRRKYQELEEREKIYTAIRKWLFTK